VPLSVCAAAVIPFRPRPRAPAAPLSDEDLVRRLLDLAKEFDRAGRARVAGLLVGAAYGMCDETPPDDHNDGHRRAA